MQLQYFTQQYTLRNQAIHHHTETRSLLCCSAAISFSASFYPVWSWHQQQKGESAVGNSDYISDYTTGLVEKKKTVPLSHVWVSGKKFKWGQKKKALKSPAPWSAVITLLLGWQVRPTMVVCYRVCVCVCAHACLSVWERQSEDF